MNSVTNNGIKNSCLNRQTSIENTFNFSISLEAGKITNQKKSGRCWMFAALNVMRLEVMEKLNLKNMELSQAYPLFWDKLEKSNYFLQNIIETADQEVGSRIVSFLLKDPLGDGGQWDMFANLIRKYGVVPKEMMPESHESSETRDMDSILTLKLRGYACDLRNGISKGLSKEEIISLKTEMMTTIYRMLCISLGEPPQCFTYETRDKNNNFVRISNITPQEFYDKYVDMNLENYISVINAPTDDKPFNHSFSVQFLGNVEGGKQVKYLNLPIESLKELAIKQLKAGKAVWFGSDVGQFSTRDTGIMAMDTYDFEGLFSTKLPMTKGQRLDYGESLMTHAMVLTGVNLDENGKPNRWCVENSWGEEPGNKGFFVMSDEWFDEFTYQIVIDKQYLSVEQLKKYDEEPIMLKPWDPMGSLAL